MKVHWWMGTKNIGIYAYNPIYVIRLKSTVHDPNGKVKYNGIYDKKMPSMIH